LERISSRIKLPEKKDYYQNKFCVVLSEEEDLRRSVQEMVWGQRGQGHNL